MKREKIVSTISEKNDSLLHDVAGIRSI